MRQHELQEQLRPRIRADLLRPCRHRLATHLREQSAVLERAVDHHRHAEFLGQRQQALLGIARDHRVVQLDEVRAAGLQRVGECVVGVVAVMGQAGVADLALRLERLGDGDLGLPVAQVVVLQQVELVGAQPPQRVVELGEAGRAAFGRELAGEEGPRVPLLLGEQVAEHVLGAAIVRRGVDRARAGGEEQRQHLAQRVAFIGAAADLEATGGAHADHRQRFIAGWDRAGLQRASEGFGGWRWHGDGCRRLAAGDQWRQCERARGEGGAGQELATGGHDEPPCGRQNQWACRLMPATDRNCRTTTGGLPGRGRRSRGRRSPGRRCR